VRVGVNKRIWSPLPLIPSHEGRGEGRVRGDISVRDRFSDLKM